MELWTGQLLTRDNGPNAHISGEVWTIARDAATSGLSGWDGGERVVYLQRDEVNLTPDVVAAAFHHASRGDKPPLEWVLFVRAERRTEPRIRLIEAASAAEVALSKAIQHRLQSAPKAALDRIITGANGLVGLTRLVEALDGNSAKSFAAQVAHRLAGPRNDAAHGGVSPTRETLNLAMTEARRILDQYSPMPPTTLGSDTVSFVDQ